MRYFYLIILLLTTIAAWRRYPILNQAGKTIVWLVSLTLLSETVARICALTVHNNMFVYHIYNPLQFFLICMFFNYSVAQFRQRNIGIYIGVAGVIVGVLNTALLQPLLTFNSYYLLFEGLMIILLSLYSFYQILIKEDDYEIIKNPNFLFTALMLVFWSFSYVFWGMKDYLDVLLTSGYHYKFLQLLVIAFYSSFLYIFINYNRLIKKDE